MTMSLDLMMKSVPPHTFDTKQELQHQQQASTAASESQAEAAASEALLATERAGMQRAVNAWREQAGRRCCSSCCRCRRHRRGLGRVRCRLLLLLLLLGGEGVAAQGAQHVGQRRQRQVDILRLRLPRALRPGKRQPLRPR